ncbi:MAG TPA: response regulator [Planctomycetia bacterium]|nr:response regulator [Planctomycetia bacterium]
MPAILVVDDRPVDRGLLCELLELYGFEVCDAEAAEDAFAIAKSKPLDLVLTDIQMPGTDGFEFITWLKNTVETRKIPIVALSANVFEEDRERARQLGALDYLAKPVDLDRLLGVIRRTIPAAAC